MPNDDTKHDDLPLQLASLSMDPHLVSRSDVLKIEMLKQQFSAAIKNETWEETLSSLLSQKEEEFIRAKQKQRESYEAVKLTVSRAYDRILREVSEFLSLPIFRRNTASWFSFLPMQELKSVCDEIRSLLSILNEIGNSLSALQRGSATSLSEQRSDIMIFLIAVKLSDENAFARCAAWHNRIKEYASETEALQRSENDCRKTALLVPVDFLPFLRSRLLSSIEFPQDGPPALKTASDLNKVFREVQAFREKVRQTFRPLFSSNGG